MLNFFLNCIQAMLVIGLEYIFQFLFLKINDNTEMLKVMYTLLLTKQ